MYVSMAPKFKAAVTSTLIMWCKVMNKMSVKSILLLTKFAIQQLYLES